MQHGPAWHLCERWNIEGMACPFPGKEEKKQRWFFRPEDLIHLLGIARARKQFPHKYSMKQVMAWKEENVGLFAEAEAVVTKKAGDVPMPGRRTLREELVQKGIPSAATGITAAWAIRQVIRSGGAGGGGYHFRPFDPRGRVQIAR